MMEGLRAFSQQISKLESKFKIMMEGFDPFPEEVTKWDVLKDLVGVHSTSDSKPETIPKVQLLPRHDVTMYGTIPKLEQRIYTKCKECRVIFNPKNVLSHKNCAGKPHHHSSSSHGLRKKMKNRGGTTPKKSYPNLPPLFVKPVPVAVVPTEPPPMVPVLKLPLAIEPKSPVKPIAVDSPQKPLITGTETVNGYSGIKHKKSKKSNHSNGSVKSEEYNPDTHCGVIEGTRPPCTRSITCSNHRIQLRKLVPGRSKDVQQLMAERKAAKEKPTMIIEDQEPCLQLSETVTESEASNRESGAGIVPIVYMPMSPISSPVEFVKIGKNVIRLESPQSASITSSSPTLLQIPNQHTDVKMYKTHPKPYAVPSYCTRRIGGAVLLANRHIESQRNDILTAIGSRAANHRPISIPNHHHHHYRLGEKKAKGCRTGPKRPSTEKNGEGKQPRLNGFVLQSSISEGADAPQSDRFYMGAK